MEMLIVYRRVDQILREKGFRIHDALLGSYCTSQEMAGFSISLLRLDDELKSYYDMPAHARSFVKAS
jgi:dihydroxyacetone kinase-like protein